MTTRPILVCGPESYFADDVTAYCPTCARRVFHRPHAPASRCQIMCLRCAARLLPPEQIEIAVTPETIADYRLWRATVDAKPQ